MILFQSKQLELNIMITFHFIILYNYHLQLFIACIFSFVSSFSCNKTLPPTNDASKRPRQTFQIAMEAGHLFVARLKLEMKKRWRKCTLPETNSSHLKMDGWNASFLLDGLFSGVSHIFIIIPKLGEDSHFEEHTFQRGWNHQLVQYIF